MLEARQHVLEVVGLPEVVGVELGDERRAGGAQRGVARGGSLAVAVVAEEAQPWVADAAQRVGGGLGRAVVDDDDLEVSDRLRERALDALADRGVRPVGGHDHAGQRRRRHGERP